MSVNLLHKSSLKIKNDVYINKSCDSISEPINKMENHEKNQMELRINNVVCSYSTRCHLNLKKIATQGMHVEYRKENGMVNMKIRKPYTTASIWSSGKITCTGAKSELDAYNAARRYCRILQKLGFNVKLCNYRVVNVLATISMPFQIDIVKLAKNYPKECSYEPELHPGATFVLREMKTTLKVFTTGSITLTAPSVDTITKAIEKISPILDMHSTKQIPHNDNLETSKSSLNNIPQLNRIIVNQNANVNILPTNSVNLTISNNPLGHIFASNTALSQALTFNNSNNIGCNLIHSAGSKHKTFLIDELDEEFLP